uniref:uncharacterized protein LOC129118290 n=1 Tax=Agelaius phoeniceus TaxID=39638 RepID=UPI0023EABF07|nr:uncharacterized protein LOC129118290 [Agelaius phoeniceus]
MGRAGERRRGGTGTRSSVRRRHPPTGAGDRPGATAARARPPRSAARPLAQQCVPPSGTVAPPVLSAMVSSSHRISWERHVPQHIPGGSWGGSCGAEARRTAWSRCPLLPLPIRWAHSGTARNGWRGAGAARTCADGPLTRKSVGGSGSRGAGPGPSRPRLPFPLCRDLLRRGTLFNIFHLSWSLPAQCAGAGPAVRARELSPEAGRLWGAPVRCGVRTGTCSLGAPLGERSGGPRGRRLPFCLPSYPVAVRPRLPQSELKPCRCLTYSGFSWPVVSTMRRRSCGLATAGTRQAAPARSVLWDLQESGVA